MPDTPLIPRASRETTAERDLLLEAPTVVLSALQTGSDGLDPDEAFRRLAESGPNELVTASSSSLWGALARQLTHPLALLLWVAALLAAGTQGATLAIAITAVIGINAAFALVQERHAEHAVAALAEYLPPHARVIRAAHELSVDARTIVPGDLLMVEEGDAICADAKLVSGAVECDLSSVTGESAPVVRQAGDDAPVASGTRLIEARDVLLSGTTCTSGEARAVVVHTGMSTELGRIAGLTSRTTREASPLEQQVRHVAWLIAAVAVAVGLAFLPLGILAGLGFGQAAIFAIGLLVANVPEGLLPTITLALAVGVADLARRGGLVKRLSAVETLGSTDVICTDKTGTLTQNRMQVHSVWDATARSAPEAAPAAAMTSILRLCTTADRESHLGDPTELALLQGADRLGRAPTDPGTVVRTFHFDPRLRLMSVLVTGGPAPGHRLLTKGAPEAVLQRCTTVLLDDGTVIPWSTSTRAAVTARLDDLADQGLRLLACAQRTWPEGASAEDRNTVERDLTLVGFVALSDPLRDAVPGAILDAHRAGITVHVITGDSGLTARAIASAAGIGASHGVPLVVNGTALEAMTDHEVDTILDSGREVVFARNTPEDKLRIAQRLQALGHVVAMTGDGVNDAPALRRADIGVAMGTTGTDVAREAATMVLTDDDFATIIRAVQAGRRVFDNVRKFILYIFAHAVPEIVPFLLYALSGGTIPLALTVTQILLIDLGTETLPALALGREGEEPGIMQRPPRDRAEGIITRPMLVRAWGVMGVVSAILVMAGFLGVLWSGGWRPGDSVSSGSAFHDLYLEATSMTFAGIVACQVGTAMAARTQHVSVLRIGFLTNRLLLLGIAFELALTALVLGLPAAQSLLDTRPLGPTELMVLATFPVIVWGADEVYRLLMRRSPPGPHQAMSTTGRSTAAPRTRS